MSFVAGFGHNHPALERHHRRGSEDGIGDNAAGFATAVPEPESYTMLLAGLGLIGAVSRRRKNKPA